MKRELTEQEKKLIEQEKVFIQLIELNTIVFEIYRKPGYEKSLSTERLFEVLEHIRMRLSASKRNIGQNLKTYDLSFRGDPNYEYLFKAGFETKDDEKEYLSISQLEKVEEHVWDQYRKRDLEENKPDEQKRKKKGEPQYPEKVQEWCVNKFQENKGTQKSQNQAALKTIEDYKEHFERGKAMGVTSILRWAEVYSK